MFSVPRVGADLIASITVSVGLIEKNGLPKHNADPTLSVGLALASDLGLPLLTALFLLFFPIANIVDALCAKPNDDDGEQHEDGNQHIEFILSHICLFVFYLQMYGIIVD